jgi:CubicO group peptidase (beta-lactamase class C family)
VTSALELSRFGQMLLRGGELDGTRIVSNELLAQAMRAQAKNHPDLDIGWGLGFEIAELQGRRLVGHSGGLAGVATRIWVMPDEGLGVVVLTNGGDGAFVSRIAERALELMLGLEPEMVPGSPMGMAAEQHSEWRELTKRAVGRYQMIDIVPPGPVSLLMGVMAKPRISHVGQGVLAIDGISPEPVLLYPDGEIGRYRVVSPFANGARAIIEERDDALQLWSSILHMQKV